MFKIRPNYVQAPAYRPHINQGALMDVPTGKWIPGLYGEYILNGGAGLITSFVGTGNLYKSTFHDHALNRMLMMFRHSLVSKYDTETSAQEDRNHFTYLNQADLPLVIKAWESVNYRFADPFDMDEPENRRFTLTDKTRHTGDEHYEKMKAFIDNKIKDKRYLTNFPFYDPFADPINPSPFQIFYPTMDGIDSLSEWQTKENASTSDERIGDKKANMLYARGGLEKSRLLGDVPARLASAGHFLVLTAHMGKAMNLEDNSPPQKALPHVRGELKLKGVAEKLTFISNVGWQVYHSSVMKHDDTKEVIYPRNSDDSFKGDTDLSLVSAVLIRNKNGVSGATIGVIISQFEGLLPSLTEFHYCKVNEYWGLVGGNQNYVCALAPKHKLQRTNIRRKLDTYPDLRRAINICAEMLQCQLLDPMVRALVVPPQQLYEGLIAKGYDWDILLATRGWYTADNHLHPIPYLSTLDLLRMYHGQYHPYWLAEDKRTILPPEKFVIRPAPFLEYAKNGD